MMYGGYNGYGGYPQGVGYPTGNGYYGNGGAMPDSLGQLRQQQFQQANQGFQQPVNTSDQIWVANETQAEAYLVAPNEFVRLWDSNKPCFYEKRCDPTGKPYPMIIYDYSIRGTTPQQEAPAVQAVQPVSEINNNYEKRINELEERVKDLESSAKSNTSNNNKKEDNRK